MIQLGSEQVLQIVLGIGAAGMAAVAGVFLLVLNATRRRRGRGWFVGFACFALALAVEALAQHDPAWESVLAYLATAAAAASAFATATDALEVYSLRRMPAWAAFTLLAADLAALAVAVRADLVSDLLAPEVALLGAVIVLAAGTLPHIAQPRRPGIRTVGIISVILTLFVTRTVVCSAILAASGRELSAFYWTWEVVFGTVLAFVLGTGEVLALLDEVRVEAEDANAALEQALRAVETAARVDSLTGLLNRYAFYATIAEMRESNALEGSMVIVDLNDLKRINDTYGHTVGDRALLHVGERLRETVRASDGVFRWGGDEFVLLLFGMDTDAARDRMARMPLPSPVETAGTRVDLAVSWGVAPLGNDVDASLREADAQLYAQRRLLRHAAAKARA